MLSALKCSRLAASYPKKLWIAEVIHALTVSRNWAIHALTVPALRINCPGTI